MYRRMQNVVLTLEILLVVSLDPGSGPAPRWVTLRHACLPHPPSLPQVQPSVTTEVCVCVWWFWGGVGGLHIVLHQAIDGRTSDVFMCFSLFSLGRLRTSGRIRTAEPVCGETDCRSGQRRRREAAVPPGALADVRKVGFTSCTMRLSAK